MLSLSKHDSEEAFVMLSLSKHDSEEAFVMLSLSKHDSEEGILMLSHPEFVEGRSMTVRKCTALRA